MPSSRHVARELAVILLPQLPKNKNKLSSLEIENLLHRASHMLSAYARECLSDAEAEHRALIAEITETETEHPLNEQKIENLSPVNVSTEQLRRLSARLERAILLVSEALEIPKLVGSGKDTGKIIEFMSCLVNMYLAHREQVDEIIRTAKSKWKIERMVSIDRDILRLACTESFFMDEVPIPVCINEAIELSHKFADEKAAKYINGILGDLAKVASEHRRSAAAQR